MSEVRVSQGWAPCRGSRGGSFPPLAASGGSRHPSLGWWPPPSRLRLHLHMASPLCPCLSSSVSYEDPVPGFRAIPIQEDLISDPSLHHTCRELVSREGPILKVRLAPNTLGWGETIPLTTASSRKHVIYILLGEHALFTCDECLSTRGKFPPESLGPPCEGGHLLSSTGETLSLCQRPAVPVKRGHQSCFG